MVLRRFTIFLMIFCIFLGVYALPDTRKGAILEMFQEKQYNLLFESSLGSISKEDMNIFKVGNRMSLYQNIKGNVKDTREAYEKKSQENLENIISLQQQLEGLEQDIKDYKFSIAGTNDKIIKTKKEIKNIQATVNILQKKITENRKILLTYVRYIYKKLNTISSYSEFDNLKGIILNPESISELLSDIHFKSIIQIAGKKLIDNHRNIIAKIYIKEIEYKKQELFLKKLRKFLIIQRSVLKEKKEFKEKMLQISRGKQSIYKKYIHQKRIIEKKLTSKTIKEKIKFNSLKKKLLKKYECDFVNIRKDSLKLNNLSEKCYTLNKIIYSESKLKGFGKSGSNIFYWPIKPLFGISAYYHDEGYKKLFGAIHDAIDIIAIQGTPVHAPADGYVILIEPPVSQDYSYLAIRHSNGYITVYGHLSEILVQEFDFVKKGQLFAKTGGEFGTNGAGYMTTGPHLHFEIFENKNVVNPLNYLSLAELPYDSLPEKYKFKFYADFKEKKGYAFQSKKEKKNVFILDGDTEIERQKHLIQKYAAPAFNDWNMWFEESLDGNIDPAFVMCIGLAETGLGKNLKTSYNVGNIGNTDSGLVRVYPDARTGIYWMVKTLNNKMLGNYNAISHLSRYGNKKGPIYASSPNHWHNNIIKCMSHIKRQYVPDDYNFRIIN